LSWFGYIEDKDKADLQALYDDGGG